MNEIKDYIDILQRKNVDIEKLDLWVEEGYQGIEDKENIEEYMMEANRIMRKYAIEETIDDEEPEEREGVEISFTEEASEAVPLEDEEQEAKKKELQESISKYEKLYEKYYEKQLNLKEEDKIRYYALKAKFAKLRYKYDRLQLKQLEENEKPKVDETEDIKEDYQLLAERYNELVEEYNELSDRYCFLKNKYRKLERRADDDVRNYVFMTLYQRYFESIRLADDFVYDEIPGAEEEGYAGEPESVLGGTDTEEKEATEEIQPEAPVSVAEEAVEEIPQQTAGEIQPEAPVSVAERTVEEIPEQTVEEIKAETPADATEEAIERIPGQIAEEIKVEASENVTEETIERVPEQATAEINAEASVNAMEETVEEMPEQIVGEIKAEETRPEAPVSVAEEAVEEIPEQTAREIQPEAPVSVAKEVVEDIPQQTVGKIQPEASADVVEESQESRVERMNRNIDDAIEKIQAMNQEPNEKPAVQTETAAVTSPSEKTPEKVSETPVVSEGLKPAAQPVSSPNSYTAPQNTVQTGTYNANSISVPGTTVYSWEAEPEAYVVEPEPEEELEENGIRETDGAVQNPVKVPQPSDGATQTPVEASQPSDGATQTPVEASQPSDGATQTPVEASQPHYEEKSVETASQVSDVAPENPYVESQASNVTTQNPYTGPQVSDVMPQNPYEAPQASDVTPQTSDEAPQTFDATTQNPDAAIPQPPYQEAPAEAEGWQKEPELDITYEDLDSVDLIGGCFWCMKNGYEQDALERLVAQMPTYYVESGILYYCENEEEKKSIVEMLQREYKNTSVSEKNKFDNINNYIMKYRSVNLGENSIKIRRSDSRQPIAGYSNVRESEEVSLFLELRRSLQLYDELCSMENELRSPDMNAPENLRNERNEKVMQYLKHIWDLKNRVEDKEVFSITAEEVYYTRGRIESYNPDKGFGRVISVDGERAHFMSSKIKDNPDLYREGVNVIYKTGKNENGYFAIDISIAP